MSVDSLSNVRHNPLPLPSRLPLARGRNNPAHENLLAAFESLLNGVETILGATGPACPLFLPPLSLTGRENVPSATGFPGAVDVGQKVVEELEVAFPVKDHHGKVVGFVRRA